MADESSAKSSTANTAQQTRRYQWRPGERERVDARIEQMRAIASRVEAAMPLANEMVQITYAERLWREYGPQYPDYHRAPRLPAQQAGDGAPAPSLISSPEIAIDHHSIKPPETATQKSV